MQCDENVSLKFRVARLDPVHSRRVPVFGGDTGPASATKYTSSRDKAMYFSGRGQAQIDLPGARLHLPPVAGCRTRTTLAPAFIGAYLWPGNMSSCWAIVYLRQNFRGMSFRVYVGKRFLYDSVLRDYVGDACHQSNEEKIGHLDVVQATQLPIRIDEKIEGQSLLLSESPVGRFPVQTHT